MAKRIKQNVHPGTSAPETPSPSLTVQAISSGREDARTAETLARSEERYRLLFDSMNEGFGIIELFDGPHGPLSDCVHVEANPAFIANAGIPDIVGRTVRELAPDEADGWVEIYRNVLITGTPVRFEREFLAMGCYFEVAAFRLEPPERRQLAVLTKNITERKHAEEALRESREQLRIALDAAEMGSWVWYPQEDRAVVDARVAQLYGAPEGDKLNFAHAIATLVHPDDRALFAAAVASAVDVNGSGQLSFDFRVIHPTGSVRWLHSHGRAFFSDENPPRAVSLYGVLLEISDRKRTEVNFAFLADLSQELVRLTNIDEAMDALSRQIGVHFNASVCVLSDVDEAAHLLTALHAWHREGVPSLAGVYPLDDFHTEEFRRASRAGQTHVVHNVGTDPRVNSESMAAIGIGAFVNVPLVRDGKWLFNLAICDTIPRDWRDDEIELMRELTSRIWTRLERAHAEQAAEAARVEADEARQMAESANRAKGDFLASMSHELRTPLNAIAGYVQLIEMGVHGSITVEQRHALQRVQVSERHLLSLVNDVLNFARIEAGRVEYDIQDVALADAVTAVMPMVEPQRLTRGLSFSVNIDPSLIVRADRDKLQQILLNLLSNSVKFTEPAGSVVIDTPAREGAPAGMVFVRVSDSGIGIPRAKQEVIFDPFVQVQRGFTRTADGTGLGLAISRDLARGMGGDLRARSVEGKGSQFTLTLPAAGPRPESSRGG